jgi:septal ring factor EnvC (AmiA/AmiB activator)
MHVQPPESDHPPGTFCERTAEAIKSLKQEIETKTREIENQKQQLTELQAQHNPDADRILELKSSVQELEDELETDREELTVLEEEFNAECLP